MAIVLHFVIPPGPSSQHHRKVTILGGRAEESARGIPLYQSLRVKALHNLALLTNRLEEFNPGSYHCYSSVVAGVITYFIPCYTAGKNAEAVGESFLSHLIFSLIPILSVWCHATIRGKIREKKAIEVSTSMCTGSRSTHSFLPVRSVM